MDEVVVICAFQMFDLNQTISVYEGPMKLAVESVKKDEIIDTILKLATKYKANKVHLTGYTKYAKKFAENLETKRLAEYSNTNFEIIIG